MKEQWGGRHPGTSGIKQFWVYLVLGTNTGHAKITFGNYAIELDKNVNLWQSFQRTSPMPCTHNAHLLYATFNSIVVCSQRHILPTYIYMFYFAIAKINEIVKCHWSGGTLTWREYFSTLFLHIQTTVGQNKWNRPEGKISLQEWFNCTDTDWYVFRETAIKGEYNGFRVKNVWRMFVSQNNHSVGKSETTDDPTLWEDWTLFYSVVACGDR